MRRITLALFFLLMTAPIAFAQSAGGDAARVIVVDGHGEAQGSPDLASLSFAIETHAPTAAEAASRNAALADKVTTVLKAKVADKGRVWSGSYSLDPDYQQHEGMTRPVIIGYNAQNSISVETTALNSVGALIDAAIAAGANRVNGLNFTLKDDTKVRNDAIASASHDAQSQAQALATALGVKLGRIVRASTVSEPRPMPVAYAMASARAVSPTTPIEPGQVSVPATVSLTYEIQ